MTPLAAPSVSSGSDRVNATALDSEIKATVAKINEIVSVVNGLRNEDGTLKAGSVAWRVVSEEARDRLSDLAAKVAEIRRQFEPKNVGRSTQSFTVPGSTAILNRILLRIRSYGTVSGYGLSEGGGPVAYADCLRDADLAGIGAWKHSQRIISIPDGDLLLGASHARSTISVSNPGRTYALNYISRQGADIPDEWRKPPLDDQLVELWAYGGATVTLDIESAAIAVLSLSATPTSGEIPLSVAFSIEVDGGTPPYTYEWDFGDSSTSTDEDPTHIYTVPGVYSPSVIVRDSAGAQTEPLAPAVVSVVAAPLVINSISEDPDTGSVPLSVEFGASIVGGVPPYTYEWDFGDGETSTDAAPTHEYTEVGTYTPSLTVTDSLATEASLDGADIVVTSADPYAANVVVLLHADGVNGATTMTDECGNAWTSRDSANLTTANAKFGPSSMDQDGEYKTWYSDDAGSDTNFGTDDFTIEGWFWPRGTSNGDYTVRVQSGGTYGPTPPTATFDGHNLAYVETAPGSGIWSIDYTVNYRGQFVFANWVSENFRFTAGVRGIVVTVDGVPTAISAGNYADITGITPASRVDVYESSGEPYNRCICGRVGTYGSYYSFRIGFSIGRFMAAGFDSGLSVWTIFGTAGAVEPNKWHHFALTRSGSTLRLFCDGVLIGTASVGTMLGTTWPMYVGSYAGRGYGNEVFDGYIDEIRVTRGVCRYAAPFTPPTEAFPNP